MCLRNPLLGYNFTYGEPDPIRVSRPHEHRRADGALRLHNTHAFYNAVRLNNFPVKTHRICGRRYAFTADVQRYFDELREEA